MSKLWIGALFAAAGLAQSGSGPPPPELALPYKAVQEYLGLNEAQLDSLRRVQHDRRSRAIDELLRARTGRCAS
ncbi:MAG TPA: hypothetical protein DEH78_32005 [Solibacterales bacterium]|nr:hypothetical protein [Bryobacterales bacterium]